MTCFELTGGTVGNIHRLQELLETEEIIAVGVKDPQNMVDEVFSIPCKEFDVKVDERKEGQTLRIKSFYQIPQLSPRQFAIRALVPKKVFPHDIPGLGLNLQKHWRILIDTQYAINLDIFGA